MKKSDKKLPTHLVPVLMGPVLKIIESRMQEILMMAYEEGLKDGRSEKP
jgi:hypothetical protein